MKLYWVAAVASTGLVWMSLAGPLLGASRFVRNGDLNQKGAAFTFKQEQLDKLRAQGWQCPDLAGWPTWWSGIGSNVKVEYFTQGGRDHGGFLRLAGKDGLVAGYHGTPLEGNQVLSFWARGRGVLRAGFLAWKMTDDRQHLEGMVPVPPLEVKVATQRWVRYRHLVRKPGHEITLHPCFTAVEGTLDFDVVDIEPSDPALDLIVAEEEKLYGTGALIEDQDFVQADAAFAARLSVYRTAAVAFAGAEGRIAPALAAGLKRAVADLEPYVSSRPLTTLEAFRYNEMVVLTRVLTAVAAGPPATAPASHAQAAPEPAILHKPGVRPVRPGAVTITDVRSDKVRYDENEKATTRATVVNQSPAAVSGTLVARMILDLDTIRELARTAFAVPAGQTRSWSFAYNVGPETYGRAVEVAFVDGTGQTLDRWQEYYGVAAEYFRIHQHTHHVSNKLYEVDPWVSYFNQAHHFASEPTDVGVQEPDAEVYISGQAGYRIHPANRRAQIAHYKRIGINSSFYQTFDFCGQMGYEVARRHPEYVLYDENGQFAVDPIYGGFPNPIELASPLEVGPRRQQMKVKPHLDRLYTPWQHTLANWADEDAVRFQTRCIKAYARAHGFTGVYIDGNMGVWKGFAHDGRCNVPSAKPEDLARLNARNHRIFSEILKQDDPNFGTWFNWGYDGIFWALSIGLTTCYGSGVGDEKNDDAIRTVLSFRNVMILDETQHILTSEEGDHAYPDKLLAKLLRQRDFVVQKYGGNTLIGYNFINVDPEKPGPTKWAWPTVNYFTAMLIAAQHHHAGGFWPSFRPGLQFMTRYSRFIWAPDVKAVPVPEVDKTVALVSPEPLWWKPLVYRLRRPGGFDLIVHLVRIPPTRKWDIHWVDEPVPLAGVTLEAALGDATVATVQACRPYHFEEPQQTVQQVLQPVVASGRVKVGVPPFRYHTMVVFRVKTDR